MEVFLDPAATGAGCAHLCRNRLPGRDTRMWSWVGDSNHNRNLYGTLLW